MKQLLEVREYDRISCNEAYEPEYKYLPENVFENLETFIRSFSGNEEQADVLEFLKIGYRRHVGSFVSVNNYVGLIQMKGGYQIQILPKIDFGKDPDSDNRETKRIFLRMLRSMKGFPGKVFNDANLKMDRMTIYEIFINMYLQEARTLVKHGLKSAYSTKEANLNFFKGKLIVKDQIKFNAAHGESFFVQYDEYMVNRAENRLIKSTLLKLQNISDSAENQKEIRQLLTAFEMVKPSLNYEKDFSKVVIDRNTRDYDMLMRWSRVFLMNQSFATFTGDTSARALLFPMEKMFESYVAQELKKALADLDWKMVKQAKGLYLFDSPRRFALHPDIVITRDDGSQIVLDTKWKRLVDKPRDNYGISQSDMYQMYAYAKKYQTSEIWLIYPVTEEMRNYPEISFSSKDNVNVRVFLVDIADIKDSMNSLKEKLIRRAE